MNALFTILTILILIASALLVVVVLLQNGKGEGLASNFIAGNQTLGVRQTADLLEKVSWVLVTFIVVLSIITSFTTGTTGADMDVTNKIENVATQSAPEFPTAPVQQEAPTAPTE
ncbi:MAG: preprotein translocase subunit SecG [Bacteroidales bacterium]|jgi:preprotein translocase subunit SecG|nr:preprotein translocase subunit SecG [Bacteroidales bacterium]